MAEIEENVTFARTLSLFDATMIGVGAMIGAGIFVLTGIAAGEAGPAAILAFALNGAVTLLTAFSYAELSSAIPEAGGGYSFVKRAFPRPIGFISGWMLWFAYTVACSLYALGFASYFWELFHKYLPAFSDAAQSTLGVEPSNALVTVLICAFFVFLNARGAEVTGKAENIITVGKILILMIFIAYGLQAIGVTPQATMDNFSPFFAKGMGGVMVAMGLTFIAFEGYDLIATVAEEIKDPEKTIPQATFISLGVTMVVYLLIVFVSLGAVHPEGSTSWEFLGEYGETAIVRAADSFMPAFGVATIVFGGLLSTMSALNATVLAASRVAFSMGRDRWLPESVSRIHPQKRTPHIAIYATGLILLVVALAFPIEVVGSAASLMFLITFTLVNLSLVVLRRKLPEIDRKYRVPLFPYVPLLGAVLNLWLAVYQFNFNPTSWFVAIGWILLGFAAYFLHFRKKSEEALPHVIEARPAIVGTSPYRILVPLSNPGNIHALLDLAIPIAKARGGDIVTSTVVQVPVQLPIEEGRNYVHYRMPLLQEAEKYARAKGITPIGDIRISHSIEEGILSAADGTRADLILMGWKGYTTTRERIFGEVMDRVVNRTHSDIAIIRLRDDPKLDRILLPTSGGPHAEFAAELLQPIVAEHGSHVDGSDTVSRRPRLGRVPGDSIGIHRRRYRADRQRSRPRRNWCSQNRDVPATVVRRDTRPRGAIRSRFRDARQEARRPCPRLHQTVDDVNIQITQCAENERRSRPNDEDIGFGRYTSDHMFLMEYEKGLGWKDPRIEPYGNLSLDPAAMVLHYNQQIFDGLKAYQLTDGGIGLFRVDRHAERINRSAGRMMMPVIEPANIISAIEELVCLDKDWIPRSPGTSLYIRPTMIATEPALGVRVARNYLFYIIAGPAGAYYPEGFNPTRIQGWSRRYENIGQLRAHTLRLEGGRR